MPSKPFSVAIQLRRPREYIRDQGGHTDSEINVVTVLGSLRRAGQFLHVIVPWWSPQRAVSGAVRLVFVITCLDNALNKILVCGFRRVELASGYKFFDLGNGNLPAVAIIGLKFRAVLRRPGSREHRLSTL